MIPGHGLTCYECKLGLWNLCITSKISCAEEQHCYSVKAKAGNQNDVTGQNSELCKQIYNCTNVWLISRVSAVNFVDFSVKGCLAEDGCNKTTTVEFPPESNNTLLTMKTRCCNTDLCNAAPGLPGASGMGLALATITALLMTKVMVWNTQRRWPKHLNTHKKILIYFP